MLNLRLQKKCRGNSMDTLQPKTIQMSIQETVGLAKTQNLNEFIKNSPLFQNQDIKLEREISLTREVLIESK
jgi:hypothetical protein